MHALFYNSIFTLALVTWSLAATMANAADITLRHKIVPIKPVITLGDIADIHASTTAERSRLALVQLWTAPPVGEQTYVTAAQVQDALARRGFSRSQLNFYGASQVAIGWAEEAATKPAEESQQAKPAIGFRQGVATQRSLADISARETPIFLSAVQRGQLADQVREAIVAHLETQTGKIGLIEVDFNLPARYADLLSTQTSEVFVSGGKAPWIGRQRLSIDFDSEQGPIEFPLAVRIFDTTPLLIAKRPVRKGQMLTAADVVVQAPTRETRMPVGKALVYQLEEALGKEAGRALREGEVVSADLCLPPLMIRRGEIVTAITSGGGIAIRRRGVAVADARQGEAAEMELLDSKDRLFGRVVGPGEMAIFGNSAPNRADLTQR